MKLGIVGPNDIAYKINDVVKKEFPQIKTTLYLYNFFTEAAKLIANQQSQLHALIFAGSLPQAYAQKRLTPLIPWAFVPRSGSSLLQALLQIALTKKYDICRISSDLYDKQQLSETYADIGIDKNKLQVYTIPKLPAEGDYIEYVCAFHEQQYENNHISCCITSLYNVHERLTAKKIPCFRVDPTADIIRQTIHKLQLNYLLQKSQQSQIVVIFIRVDAPREYSLYNENEYQYILDKTNVTRQIFLFAQRVQAAVIEVGAREFLLFSTKFILENATNNFENIDLLQSVKNSAASTISIGVGYGQTAQEAKFNANLGMERANKLGGDAAFIVYSDDKIIGPIRDSRDRKLNSAAQKIDQSLLTISDKTGISVNTIFRLQSIVEYQGRTRFTTAELAELAGVTQRTMNRVIEKLTLHGYCFEVGKRMQTNLGRPRRIIEICIPKS